LSIEDKILDLNFQRKVAKTALGVSMGITALTALNMNSRMSQLHKISGLVMLASAIWHASLYGSPYSEFLKNRKAKALALRNEDFDLNFTEDDAIDASSAASGGSVSTNSTATSAAKTAPKRRRRIRKSA
jgi:hypothetical protein